MQNLNELHLNEVKDSQLPAVEILVNLGWKYISKADINKERKNNNSKFILTEIAKEKLMEINDYEVGGEKYKFSDKDIYDAIEEMEKMPFDGMTSTSEKIFNTIMPTSGGRTIKVNVNGKNSSQNFKFIDFANIENNSFHVAVEYIVSGKQDIRPDIVCFVNGLPFVVIENKRSSVAITDAISDLIKKQNVDFAPRFFAMAQLLIAANGNEVQYGATGTPAKFYAVWKEKSESQNEFDAKVQQAISKKIDENLYMQVLSDLNENKNSDLQSLRQDLNRLATPQDRSLFALLQPKRLLDLTKNCILFDAGIKKVSRYQQYFAIDKILKKIDEREMVGGNSKRKGGIVWHTQGSGKSLTMVMFVKALIENPNIINPRVIIVTDRKDLDRQIRDTFKNCNLKKEVTQATSGQHLIDLIKNKTLNVITTLVFKFDSSSKNNSDFSDTDENIFVLIDEAHRSQNGMANLQMNKIIPNACYIAFTGTPLMKDEKATYKKFGDYIDKYTIDDALVDGVVLPLIYEGRFINAVSNNEMIDKHLERLTENLNDKDKKALHRNIKKKDIKSNPQIVSEIAYDIENHFSLNFQGTGLKAQLVAPSKYSAILFQKFFETSCKIKTATVISDENFDVISDEGDHKKEVLEFLNNIKTTRGNIEKYEKEVIDSFKNNEDGIEIIIVVDKLLTGFDAPRNTILYLCKDLKDHNLLQAIARVNRLFENKKLPKTAGYIIDYSENAKNIDSAMKLFGNYDEEDVKNTLIDIKNKVIELS
jgi:type I restriction enzyme, R subunit